MKEGKYYFDKLSDKQQIEFKENINKTIPNRLEYLMKSKYVNFFDFMSVSFSWVKTTQGYNYWHEISKKF